MPLLRAIDKMMNSDIIKMSKEKFDKISHTVARFEIFNIQSVASRTGTIIPAR